MKYNPAAPPDPAEWLALDEAEQVALVEAHHRRARIQLPAPTLHAAIHVVVERQIAMALEPVVRAMTRMGAQGLDRHDAIHAVGAVLAEQLARLQAGKRDSADPNTAYVAALDGLSAASWRQQFESE